MKTAYPTQRMTPLAQKLIEAVGQSVHGKEDVIELAVITLFAGGHLLIEDLPGVGKTLLARSLAQSLDLPFQRIQCTAKNTVRVARHVAAQEALTQLRKPIEQLGETMLVR